MADKYPPEYRAATNNRVPGRKTGFAFFSNVREQWWWPTAIVTFGAAVLAGAVAALPFVRDQHVSHVDQNNQPVPPQLGPGPEATTRTDSLGAEVHERAVLDLDPKTASPAAIPSEGSGLGIGIGL